MSSTIPRFQTFYEFHDPWVLLILFILPFLFYWESRQKPPTILFSSLKTIGSLKPGWKVRLYPLLLWARRLVLVLVIFGLARLQAGRKSTEVITHGVDILLAIDTSGSMRAEDFMVDGNRVTRLDAVKSVVSEFIDQRKSDRIGMVVFGSLAFTQCPLTLDHSVAHDFLQNLEIGMAGEQTAIGDALATATSRLKDLESRSRIVILLTDGANTAGAMDPLQAADIADAFNVKVYTIGVGSQGEAPVRVNTPFGPQYQYIRSDLNEEILQEMAKRTRGSYFRASDTAQLDQIYKTIDQLEKTKAKVKEHVDYNELFPWFLLPAFLLLAVERVLDLTIFRRVP